MFSSSDTEEVSNLAALVQVKRIVNDYESEEEPDSSEYSEEYSSSESSEIESEREEIYGKRKVVKKAKRREIIVTVKILVVAMVNGDQRSVLRRRISTKVPKPGASRPRLYGFGNCKWW